MVLMTDQEVDESGDEVQDPGLLDSCHEGHHRALAAGLEVGESVDEVRAPDRLDSFHKGRHTWDLVLGAVESDDDVRVLVHDQGSGSDHRREEGEAVSHCAAIRGGVAEGFSNVGGFYCDLEEGACRSRGGEAGEGDGSAVLDTGEDRSSSGVEEADQEADLLFQDR